MLTAKVELEGKALMTEFLCDPLGYKPWLLQTRPGKYRLTKIEERAGGTTTAPNGVEWKNSPARQSILQWEIDIRPEDLGKYAVSKIDDCDDERFYTPLTPVDKQFWLNGLDDCEYVHQSIQLFDDPNDAKAAIQTWQRRFARLYQLEIKEQEIQLVLVDEEAES